MENKTESNLAKFSSWVASAMGISIAFVVAVGIVLCGWDRDRCFIFRTPGNW